MNDVLFSTIPEPLRGNLFKRLAQFLADLAVNKCNRRKREDESAEDVKNDDNH